MQKRNTSSRSAKSKFTQADEAEVLAMVRWAAAIWRSDLTVGQVQAKIRTLHALLETVVALNGALIEELKRTKKKTVRY